jgi:glyoxylase-like metal-dependent hydrolase (beta-lactamase superfamily II)
VNVGSMTVDPIVDGRIALPAEIEYPDQDPASWDPFRHLLENGTDVVNEIGGWLVRGHGNVVVVDCGFGPAEVEGWETGHFMESLAGLGVQPADVTDVVFTHLHFDHIGWATLDGKATFPEATYRCHEADWPFFIEHYVPRPEELEVFPHEMLPKNKLRPVAETIVKWSGSAEILPGIQAIETPGHSPGHCALRITSDGEAAMLAGDIAHHQAELLTPGFQGVADADEVQARESRRWLAEHLAETGTPFVTAHFWRRTWGRIVIAADRPGGLDWQPYEA